jgi:hypothetical protein
MSIAKKGSKKTNTEPLRRKSQKKYVVTETTMRDFIESLSIHDIDAAATRLQAIADITAEMLNNRIDRISQSDLKLMKQLARESKNKYYQQIMKAVIASIGQGPQGMKAAHLTAARTVELAFRWVLEYFATFDLYREKLRSNRQGTIKRECCA